MDHCESYDKHLILGNRSLGEDFIKAFRCTLIAYEQWVYFTNFTEYAHICLSLIEINTATTGVAG